jgi:hypothetical protein
MIESFVGARNVMQSNPQQMLDIAEKLLATVKSKTFQDCQIYNDFLVFLIAFCNI